MKLLLLLLVIGASQIAGAQDWDCFIIGQRPFFTNGDGYVRGIRIDSVTTAGPNRIFHPYRSPRGPWRMAWLDTAGGSWVGKRVVARQDGVWEFDTRFGDTVFIHTQAAVGSSWRFHDDTGSRYCTATVLSQSLDTISGIADSVKVIEIRAFIGGVPVADTIDGLRIILSKHHGFISLPDLHSFPYSKGSFTPNDIDQDADYYTAILVGKNLFGTRLTKTALMFTRSDFRYPTTTRLGTDAAGNIFHYKSVNAVGPLPPEGNFVEIDSIGANSLVYTQRWTTRITPFGTQVEYLQGTTSTLLAGLPLVDTNAMPETYKADFWYYRPTTSSSSWIPTVGVSLGPANYKYYVRWNQFAGPNLINTLEPCRRKWDVYLFDSLGAVYQRDCFAPVGDGSHYAGLIYARVGNKTFGSPLATPNVSPANSPAIQWRYTGDGHSIAVSTAGLQPPATVALLNAAGQKVFYQQLSTPSAEIQINSLPAGIYFLTVATQHKRSSAKISIASR